MDYNITFAKRGDKYKYAIDTYPRTMDAEFQTAIFMCDLKPTDVLLNIPAACIPLKNYFRVKPAQYIEFETNKEFARIAGLPQCEFTAIPLGDATVTKILCLSTLHHSTDAEREAFYAECWRILKPGGVLIIGDVEKGSAQDKWLNIFVNQYNSAGHNGRFWSAEDLAGLEAAGFSATLERKTYTWNWENYKAMLDFCKNLFGLDLATDVQILDGVLHYLRPRATEKGYEIDWSLGYFRATKGAHK
jgi:SAM-dependent methyltransferase